jgi:hypothetical protein
MEENNLKRKSLIISSKNKNLRSLFGSFEDILPNNIIKIGFNEAKSNQRKSLNLQNKLLSTPEKQISIKRSSLDTYQTENKTGDDDPTSPKIMRDILNDVNDQEMNKNFSFLNDSANKRMTNPHLIFPNKRIILRSSNKNNDQLLNEYSDIAIHMLISSKNKLQIIEMNRDNQKFTYAKGKKKI